MLGIFDDTRGRWGPLTRLRPIFSQRTGMLTTRRRIERRLGQSADAFVTSKALGTVTEARHPRCVVNQPLPAGDWLLVNGRWLAVEAIDRVAALPQNKALLDEHGDVVAAHFDAEKANRFLRDTDFSLPDAVKAHSLDWPLISRPWQVLDHLPATLEADLAHTTLGSADYHALRDVTVFGSHRVYLGEDARLDPGTIINVEDGPVAIGRNTRVHPGALLEGPCSIGRDSAVVAQAYIRPYTVTGPVCKLGGEVVRSIFQACTNKAHTGCLGDALVGAWCNFGASTVASNLKNTYSPVRIALDEASEPEDTGRRNLGPILGDLVRTAIGTRLLTGAVIDTGCMLAMSGFAPKLAAPLGFYTDAGRSEYDIDKLIDTAAHMMSRRDVELLDAEAALLRGLASA